MRNICMPACIFHAHYTSTYYIYGLYSIYFFLQLYYIPQISSLVSLQFESLTNFFLERQKNYFFFVTKHNMTIWVAKQLILLIGQFVHRSLPLPRSHINYHINNNINDFNSRLIKKKIDRAYYKFKEQKQFKQSDVYKENSNKRSMKQISKRYRFTIPNRQKET